MSCFHFFFHDTRFYNCLTHQYVHQLVANCVWLCQLAPGQEKCMAFHCICFYCRYLPGVAGMKPVSALGVFTADKCKSRRSPFQLIHILWGCRPLSATARLVFSSLSGTEPKSIPDQRCGLVTFLKTSKEEGGEHKQRHSQCSWFILSKSLLPSVRAKHKHWKVSVRGKFTTVFTTVPRLFKPHGGFFMLKHSYFVSGKFV